MRKVLLVSFAVLLAVSLAGCTIFRMPGATLHGTVLLEGGAPAANAKITFTPASDYGSSITGYAAADGTWTTERFGVKPDGYSIKFEHPDAGQPSTISYKVCLPFKTYDVGIVYLWGAEAEDLVTVTGVVFENDGLTTVEGATVIFDYQGTPEYTVLVTTDAAGEFEVPGILAGSYEITASKVGYTFTPVIEDLSDPENTLELKFNL